MTSCTTGSKLVRSDPSEAKAISKSVLVVLSGVDGSSEVSKLPTSGGVDALRLIGPSAHIPLPVEPCSGWRDGPWVVLVAIPKSHFEAEKGWTWLGVCDNRTWMPKW
jgi:hypothetical protein